MNYTCPDCGSGNFEVQRGSNWAVFCAEENCQKLILACAFANKEKK